MNDPQWLTKFHGEDPTNSFIKETYTSFKKKVLIQRLIHAVVEAEDIKILFSHLANSMMDMEQSRALKKGLFELFNQHYVKSMEGEDGGEEAIDDLLAVLDHEFGNKIVKATDSYTKTGLVLKREMSEEEKKEGKYTEVLTIFQVPDDVQINMIYPFLRFKELIKYVHIINK